MNQKTFGYPEFDSKGCKVLTKTQGEYSDMLQNITVYRLSAGQELDLLLEQEEMAVLLVQGNIVYSWESNGQCRNETAVRESFFWDKPYCLHVSKAVAVKVSAETESEILVQATPNDRVFDSVFYTPELCREETFGAGEFEGKAQRTVRTLFDYDNAPYSNIVMGEILIPQGGWSSYPPHHHPQPEVYYYRFDKPQGFGACFIGEETHKIKDGSFAAIPGGLCHPQVNAPGYPMYYVWMIRHFDDAPWRDRIFAPEHLWLLEQGK